MPDTESPHSMAATATASAPAQAAAAAPGVGPVGQDAAAPPPARHRLRLLALVAVIVLAAAGLWKWQAGGAQTESSAALRTAVVTRGDFVRSVRVHGLLQPVQFHGVAAPRLSGPGMGSLVITKLAGGGQPVQRGDLVVEFDRQAQIKNAFDRAAEYHDLEEQIKKKQAEQAAARALDQTELQAAENALHAARLDLRRNEIVSQIDAEKNQQAYAEAEARLAQLRRTLELKRQAAEADLRILEIQRDRARSAMLHARGNSEKMAIRSPIDGIAVLNTIWKGGQMAEVQEGDEVRPGQTFLQIVNPASMEIRARVNQADVKLLHVGQPARITLDAFPGLTLPGRVERVATIGVTSGLSQKVRTFQVVFSVEGSDARLMPDLSAAVDVELERIPGVLVASRDAVVRESGQEYAWVREGARASRRPVQVGAMNAHQVVIESGVEEGATLLRNPAAGGAQP